MDTPGSAWAVAVSGNRAYVADEYYGLQVIDITNPASPQIIGSVDTPGLASNVAISGHYAYVADWGFGLRVINITNPASPQIVGSVDTPNMAHDVAMSGPYVYVADGTDGLLVIDVMDPGTPRIVGSMATCSAWGVAVSETHVYATCEAHGLQILPLQCDLAASVRGEDRVASEMLLKAYPNPGSGQVFLHIETRAEGPVRAVVCDLAGRLIRRLFDGTVGLGGRDLWWDGRSEDGHVVPAGMYLARLSTAKGAVTGRFVVVR